MHILGKWEPLMPGSLAVIDKDSEVLFKPLVCLFGLAVSLGVVGRAYVLFNVEDAAKFFGEMRGKAGIPVSNDFAWGTIVWEDMLDVKVGDGGGGGSFVAGNEDSSF